MKKVLIILSAVFALFILTRCCGERARFYRIKGIYEITHSENGYDFINDTLIVDTSKFLRYQIRIAYDIDLLASTKIANPFITNASASEKCDPSYASETKDTIKKLEVRANVDLDSLHLKGSLLNDLFYYSWSYDYIGSPLSTTKFADHDRGGYGYLHLLQRPNTTKNIIFKINMELKNGRYYSSSSSAVRFKQ